MKQLTRLINYKTKKSKTNIKTYNPFETGGGGGGGGSGVSDVSFPTVTSSDGNDEMSHWQPQTSKAKTSRSQQPKVHKYQKSNEIATNMAKMKTKGGHKMFHKASKPTMTTSSSSAVTGNGTGDALQPITAATKSSSSSSSLQKCNGNSINYTSLKRMRNNSNASSCTSHSMECRQAADRQSKRKWQFLLWKCCRNRKRKSPHLQRLKQRKTQRRQQRSYWASLKKFLLEVLRCRRFRLASSASSSGYPYDSQDDEDIDAKFTAYIMEMKKRDAREEAAMETTRELTSAAKSLTSMTSHLDTNLLLLPNPIQTPSPNLLLLKTNPANKTRIASNPLTQMPSPPCTPPPTPKLTHIAYSPKSNVPGNRVSFASDCADPLKGGSVSPPNQFIHRRHSQHQLNAEPSNKTLRAWTWDDSLRSNSDRFLETLEEDGCDFVIIKEAIIETASTSVNSSRGSVARTRPSLQQMLSLQDQQVNDELEDVGGDFVIIQGGTIAGICKIF